MYNTKRLLKKSVLIVIILIVAGLAGFMIGKRHSTDGKSNDPSASGSEESVYSSASDLRKALNIALAEHISLTSETVRASYDNHESSTALVDQLDKNSQEIAGIIGGVYGEEAKSAFLKTWRDHVTFFVNYTVSAKSNDKEGKEQALSDLEDYSRESAEFFAGLNSNLTADSLKPLFTKHRDLIIALIDDYVGAKYVESLDKESQAYEQAGKLADTLTDGIIKQFPDKFSE